MKLKHCTRCGEKKPLTDFHNDKSTSDGLRNKCKPCDREVTILWQQKNSEKFKEQQWTYRLMFKYGLTPEDYNRLLVEQSGSCRICHGLNASGIKLAVDHDHVTGKIRGLLCTACNTAIGKLKDDPKLLRRAAEYVEGVLND